jgi:hypothetical protein
VPSRFREILILVSFVFRSIVALRAMVYPLRLNSF